MSQRIYKHVTVSSSALTLTGGTIGYTAAEVAKAVKLTVTGDGGDIRYAVAGEVPTASQGHLILNNVTTEFSQDVPGMQFIRKSADVTTTFELETEA